MLYEFDTKVFHTDMAYYCTELQVRARLNVLMYFHSIIQSLPLSCKKPVVIPAWSAHLRHPGPSRTKNMKIYA